MLSKNKAYRAALLPIFLGGCADYMNHRDSITLGAGNTSEANAAIHEKYPWPRNVSNTAINTHGNQLPAGKTERKKQGN